MYTICIQLALPFNLRPTMTCFKNSNFLYIQLFYPIWQTQSLKNCALCFSLWISKTLSCMPSFVKICFKVCLNLIVSKRLDGAGAVTSRKILRVLGFYLETLKFIKFKIQYRSLLTFKYLMSVSMTKLVWLTAPIQVNVQ